jgi:integrase/recombinase XerD
VADVDWPRYPRVGQLPFARTWLTIQSNLGLAANTISAYARGLEGYLSFASARGFSPEAATREHVSAYVRELSTRPSAQRRGQLPIGSESGLANATLQLRLTVVRLFYDYLMEEGIRQNNPVGRGRYTPGKGFGGTRDRGLLPRYRKLPWIPNDEQWRLVVETVRRERLRNRVMLVLSYDAALRREELCSLETGDIDPALRLLRIRAETTKNRQERIVPYSEAGGALYAAYVGHRNRLSRERGPLFLSESRRNRGLPVSIWTWSKVVNAIAERSGVSCFTTHTPRHLRLTDLARANWDIKEIAVFAGHRCFETTLRYIHLSGRELAQKLERGMGEIHAWRMKALAEVLA